jgi:hypothetical protein
MEDLKCTNCGNQMSAAPKAPQQVSNTPQDGAPDQSVYNTIASRYFASPPQQQEQSDTAEEDAYLIDRLSHLLAEIAIAIRGPEPALTKWGYADLPDLVRELVAKHEAHPLHGLHINQGSMDAAADAYEAEYNAAHTGHDICGWTWVKTDAVNWLKEHHPKLCIKAGLAEMVGNRLYTISRLPLTDTNVRMLQKQLDDLRSAPTTPTATASQESTPTRDQTGREPT